MKLTVLVDNNTIIDKYYYGEPGLSFYIEHDNKKILFDTGYSNIFMQNAQKSKINFLDLDCIVISHGHDDHTGGLVGLSEYYSKNIMETTPVLIAHKDAFKTKMEEGTGLIGSPLSEKELSNIFKLKLTTEPYYITENIVFLGEIPRKYPFEQNNAIGYLPNLNNQSDFVLDDSALVINSSKGLIVITGCSHSGIANICEYAKTICSNDKIISIIGGLHLKDANADKICETVKYLKTLNLQSLYACHCTGFKAQCELSKNLPIKEVGSGLEILEEKI